MNRPGTTGQLSAQQPGAATERAYQPSPASALVFDSAVMPNFPLPGLDRQAREPSAFLGFDQSTTESFFIFTDDEQSSFPYQDSYDRESVSARIGTRSR